ncbi:DUF624 domain-containing protein [Candidatus Arthromitus sp. SFB-turkey]|uniref:DUF624 domain-containing protein n=1 Tax=Candidatus Arthromitus sp. SFB-turkey TaxID=1840217 RepID=UPI0007F32DAF|nr:DUF624 domain-containing protein [Candidatus Arthromitus sp. SFB-turkey]OAT88287.1 hypothetical protein A6P36_04080 [Candidatus Arthromitus sp. SFB-turkey]
MLNEIFNLDKILETFNYIFWFFTLNLLFWIFNIPIILFFIFIGISNILTYFPLFLVCLVPVMPTFTVILYCMNKLYKNKNIEVIPCFLRGFKLNFGQALFVWCVELVTIFLIFTNINFFSVAANSFIIPALFICLLILISAMTPYLFLIISRFSITSLQVLRLSFILTFTRPLLTITNLLLVLVFMVLFEISPAIIILFISTLLGFCLIFINRTLLSELENISKNNN